MITDPGTKRGGIGQILGVGALACIACCIGPILGVRRLDRPAGRAPGTARR